MRSTHRRPWRVFSCTLLLLCFFAATVSSETITLTWATWGPQVLDRQLIEAFEREHPNIRIEYIASANTEEHHPKMKVLAASGVGPDVFAVDGVYLLDFVAAGLIQPIDDLLAADDSVSLDDFFPAALPDVQYQGKTYGLPYISSPLYMVYNVDHFNEAGLAKPDLFWDRATFESYVRALTRVVDGEVIRHGSTQYLQTVSHAIWPWLWSEGGRMFSEDNTRFMMTEPEAISVMTWLQELGQAGFLGGGENARFYSEQASIHGMYPGGFPSVTGREWPFEWDVIIHPAGPAGQYSVWKGNVMAISSSTDKREAAWTFLKWLLSPTGGGYEIYVANRRFPPATRDFDLWRLYQGEGTDPVSLFDVTMLLATQHGRPLPRLLNWDEMISRLIRPTLARIASGSVSPAIAMEEIRPAVEQLLAQEPR